MSTGNRSGVSGGWGGGGMGDDWSGLGNKNGAFRSAKFNSHSGETIQYPTEVEFGRVDIISHKENNCTLSKESPYNSL